MARDYTLPKEPPCPSIQEPGPPVKIGEGLGVRTSVKINPDAVVPPDPNAPKRQY